MPRFRSLLNSLAIPMALFAIHLGEFSGPAFAQPQRRGIPAPKETILPASDVVVEMYRFRRLPVVELMINETGPFRMIVDTGASGLVVTPKLAEKLELPSPPGMPAGMQVQVKTPGGNVPATLNYVDKIDIGNASFKGVWTIATSMPFGDGMDGVIGMNVFKECLLTYDYPNNRVVLSHGELPNPNGIDVLAYETPRMPDSHPMIQISIDGKSEKALIDTGMRGWFAVPREAIDDFQVLQGPSEWGLGMSVGKPRPNMVARLQASFNLGDNQVKDPTVRLADDFMVGTLFLENFAVTFDGKNKRVRLTRDSGDPLVQPALRGLGFDLKRMGDQMVIWNLFPDSDAAAKGMKVDDIVIELNGKPATDAYDTKELLEAIQAETSMPVVYKPGDGEKAMTVNISLVEFNPTDNSAKPAESNKPSVDAKTIEVGKAAYKQGMCAKCHAQDGTGSDRGPNLTDAEWFHCDGSGDGIMQVLLSGIPKTKLRDKSRPFAMNPATNLIKDESMLAALAQYVLSLRNE